jgi:hypothetical protein
MIDLQSVFDAEHLLAAMTRDGHVDLLLATPYPAPICSFPFSPFSPFPPFFSLALTASSNVTIDADIRIFIFLSSDWLVAEGTADHLLVSDWWVFTSMLRWLEVVLAGWRERD